MCRLPLVALNIGLLFNYLPTASSAQETAGGATDLSVTHIEELCEAFESARVRLNYAKSKGLVLPGAMAFQADGRSAHPLLGAIQKRSTQNKDEGPFEPIRVLNRNVTIMDNLAIVNELLGASRRIEAGTKITPHRRTITWMKGDEGWKVASLHSSKYESWEKSITAYEEQDVQSAPKPGGIVFVGSSSIRGWKTLNEDFSDLHVIGRGFGGSQLIDSVMYAHRIVTPYKPRAVAVYAGDNDVAAGKTSRRVLADFKELVATIHTADPEIRIGFIAIKPSLKRWQMWPTMEQANDMVAEFAAADDRLTFLDIATPMLGADGKPKPELFVKDGLHLSPPGYAMWTKVVMPWASP